MGDFTHLHVHTEFSLLDGAARIKNLFPACKARGMNAIAITDHGNLYGAVDFEEAAEKYYKNKIEEVKKQAIDNHWSKEELDARIKECDGYKIKTIIGCEFYVCSDMHEKSREYYHLILLAKNETGWKNLVKMDSLAFVEGYYYHPRIDYKLLREHSEGLVCLSACIAGYVPDAILQNNYDLAVSRAKELAEMFEPGDFYIELQDHGLAEERKCLPQLYKLARENGFKVIATNDVHYIEKEDAEMQDVLLCVQTGKVLEDPDRMKFGTDEFYLKSYDEMAELFSWCPEALSNTREIVGKCNCKCKRKNDLIPGYIPDNGMTSEEYIRKITYEGFKIKYPDATQEIKDRVEYELGIIHKMQYDEYFLIVWDYINYAKSIGIPVGPGRGSGVGSIVAYCMGITDVEPLRFSLLFERFLNPERVSMPDFDVDFCNEGRGTVIEYVIRKYGADRVAQIITFGTMKAKNAIRDVGRVYGIPYGEVDKIAKLVPGAPGVTLAGCMGELDKPDSEEKQIVPDMVALYENDDTARRIIDMARKLEGMPRNTSKHACGVVISKRTISDYVPLQRNGDDVTIQYVAHTAEDLGLLKMDFLGLITLTDIKKCKQYIRETVGDEVDFLKLGYDDPQVYDLLSSGETDAVFQLESAGMKNFMKQLRPHCLEDVIAGISLFRPGPMKYIPKYVESKNNPERISYDHPLLESILKPTYGCIVYQEQVMQIVQKLGGYTLGRADLVRRAMGKKKQDVMAAEKNIFIHGKESDGIVEVEGCIRRGVSEEIGTKIFDDMADFAKYAFNKSHAAAYAVLAYQTAYFKRYYPVQFLAAVINNRITKSDEVSKYVNYARSHGIDILPPDINKSDVRFSVEGDHGIRIGLCAVKGVGEAPMIEVIKERETNGPYKSIEDMCDRLESGVLNKRIMENLIKAGAFDTFGRTRATMMQMFELIMDLTSANKKNATSGQQSLFDEGLLNDDIKIDYVEVKEFERKFKLAMEKEVVGVYVTGHPLEGYEEEYKKFNFKTSQLVLMESDDEEDVGETYDLTASGIYDRMPVVTGGIMTEVTHKYTKKGTEICLAKLEDYSGYIELLMNSATYQKYKPILIDDTIVKIEGTMMVRDGRKPSISVRKIEPWHIDGEPNYVDEANNGVVREQEEVYKLYLKVDTLETYDKVMDIIDGATGGKSPVYIQYDGKLLNTGKTVRFGNTLMWQFWGLLGESNVKKKDF